MRAHRNSNTEILEQKKPNSTSRYLDDLLNIDNTFFDSMVNNIYPSELQLNNANVSETEASVLDLHLSISDGLIKWGWSGGAMVLGKLLVPGRPTIWTTVGHGPIVLAVDAGGGCLDIFALIYHFSFLSPSLWETARYRLKYCLKGPLNTKQPTYQPMVFLRLKFLINGMTLI